MKLVSKVVGALTVGMMLVLAAHGALTFAREKKFFRDDMEHDGYLLAHAMGEAMLRVWATDGQDQAIEFLRAVDAHDEDIGISWIPSNDPMGFASLTPGQRKQLDEYRAMSLVEADQGVPNLHTYLKISGLPDSGAIHIVESLAKQHEYVRTSAIRLSITILFVLLLFVLLALWVGHQWVGKPVSKLIEKTRRVGHGDLISHVDRLPKDELGTLGAALNTMSDELFEARNRRDEEHLKRLTTEVQLRHAQRLTTVGTLASGVAHEIGTPLNVISAHAKMIARRQVDSEEAVESSNTIVQQTERITGIVKQLLGFARRRAPRTEDVEMSQLLKDSVELLRPLTKGTNVTVIASDLDTRLRVVGDVGQLQQVIANLVTNGIHAMPEGGTLTISLSTQEAQPPLGVGDAHEGEYVCLRVEDEGSGIGEADLGRIFDPFFTTKQVGEGTGLGLSVAHGIIRDHHGWIDVHSEVGKGTRFIIFLPQSTES